jgi:HEAT repeat protein
VAAVNGLAAIGAVEADVALTKLLANDDPALRAAAANALGELRRSRPVDQRRMAKDAAALLSLAGATSLATKPDGEAGPILAEALRRAPLDVERRIAAAGLGRLGDQTQAQALIDALTDSDALVRVYAAESLAQLKHTAAVPWLLMAMEAGPAGEAAYEAFRALGGPDIGYRPGAGQLARSVAVDAGMAWWTRTGSKAAGN